MKSFQPVFNLPDNMHIVKKMAEKGSSYALWLLGNDQYTKVDEKDYRKKALELYKKAAQAGSTLAHKTLASIYAEGIGTITDHVKARKHLLTAAKQGAKDCQLEIGLTFLFGKNVKQDFTKARRWLQTAQDNQQLAATFYLAYLDTMGAAPIISEGETILRLQKLALAGNSNAMFALGVAELVGYGFTSIDAVSAFKWIKRAADAGVPAAQMLYGKDVLNGIHFEANTDMGLSYLNASSQQGFEAATLEIARYKVQDSERGNEYSEGMEMLAGLIEKNYAPAFAYYASEIFEHSTSREEDAKAIEICKKGIAAHNMASKIELVSSITERSHPILRDEKIQTITEDTLSFGMCSHMIDYAGILLQRRDGSVQDLLDPDRGIFWLQCAVNEMNPVAMYLLAEEYAEGKHVQFDNASASALYQSSANLGYHNAVTQLAFLHLCDKKFVYNPAFSAKLHLWALKNGCVRAAENLALQFERGEGVEIDFEKAGYLRRLVAEYQYTDSTESTPFKDISDSFVSVDTRPFSLGSTNGKTDENQANSHEDKKHVEEEKKHVKEEIENKNDEQQQNNEIMANEGKNADNDNTQANNPLQKVSEPKKSKRDAKVLRLISMQELEKDKSI